MGGSGTRLRQDAADLEMTKAGRQDQFDGAYFALNAAAVARALMISETMLDQLVAEGRIPKPFAVPGHPRLLRWDAEDVRNLVREWKETANPGSDKGWDDVR